MVGGEVPQACAYAVADIGFIVLLWLVGFKLRSLNRWVMRIQLFLRAKNWPVFEEQEAMAGGGDSGQLAVTGLF